MPLKLWKTGLRHSLSRISEESLLEQLTRQQKALGAFELTSEEPIEKVINKSHLLSNQVA